MVTTPGVELIALQVSDDARKRGADDRLIERRQEQAKQDREQDLHPRPFINVNYVVAALAGWRGGLGRAWRGFHG